METKNIFIKKEKETYSKYRDSTVEATDKFLDFLESEVFIFEKDKKIVEKLAKDDVYIRGLIKHDEKQRKISKLIR